MELANKLALQYNARLKDMLAQLNKELDGATFVHANVFDLVMELITNYDKYGKTLELPHDDNVFLLDTFC